ncbi:MAG: hypothetical protein KY456_11045 [Chloroflexi bacterium]|nr:hypothetical protein [Chloroflexota bacterium]
MRRALIPTVSLGLCLVALSGAGFGPARAAQDPGCDGSWLVHITLEGRDLVEDVLIAFEDGGAVEVHSPPVMPALPGLGEVPLQASSGLGTWQSTGERECAFEYVRLLAGDDGVSAGTLNVRGVATADGGDAIDGSLTIIRSTGFGQTAATSEGVLSGTTLDGPLLWLTPTADQPPAA